MNLRKLIYSPSGINLFLGGCYLLSQNTHTYAQSYCFRLIVGNYHLHIMSNKEIIWLMDHLQKAELNPLAHWNRSLWFKRDKNATLEPHQYQYLIHFKTDLHIYATRMICSLCSISFPLKNIFKIYSWGCDITFF